ncbi:MAG: NAD(P)/FAD-dependent oxidoreductase [bacterium]|nr:NAD(P)/FAD-dependent oxidoreductase [bacterium]MCP5066891.1 NAD(P)/FAD-dependent oxidoreductase [bacterium]
MTEIEDLGEFDAIVIGAGLAGLMAGNSLAASGHRVLMLEKHGVPGGCTVNFERKGYRFEASNHVINGCAPGGMTYRLLERIGAQERVEFIHLDDFGRRVDEERGTDVTLPWALDGHVEMLIKNFPDEQEGIRSFYGKYGSMAEALLTAQDAGEDLVVEESSKLAEEVELYSGLGGRKAPEVLREHVSDPDLIELMLAIPSGFLGTSSNELDASLAIMCDLVFRVGGGQAYYPKGGSGRMTQVLAELFEERGGTLLLDQGVSEISFDGGRASGIVSRRRAGRSISARARTVIHGGDVTAFASRLCPQGTLPDEYVRGINQRRPSISALTLFAGLDLDLPAMGITDCEISRSWKAGGDSPFFVKGAVSGDYSDLPWAAATIYSNIDPTCCPKGKSIVATMLLASPEIYEEALGTDRHRGRAYKALKDRLLPQLIEKMERALGIPDLEKHAEVLELATPVTIERFTENRGGAYVGWRYSPNQVQDSIPQRSPVENIFLCGHWVRPGGGVSNAMAGGLNAAELAAQYLAP